MLPKVNKICLECKTKYEVFGVDMSGYKLSCPMCYEQIMVTSEEYEKIKPNKLEDNNA